MSALREGDADSTSEAVDTIDEQATPRRDSSPAHGGDAPEEVAPRDDLTASTNDHSRLTLPLTRRSAVVAGALGLVGVGLGSDSAGARPPDGGRGRAIPWQKNYDANGYWLKNLGALTTEGNPTPVLDFEGANLAIDNAGNLGVGPQGAGSGLDADLVDGLEAEAFTSRLDALEARADAIITRLEGLEEFIDEDVADINTRLSANEVKTNAIEADLATFIEKVRNQFDINEDELDELAELTADMLLALFLKLGIKDPVNRPELWDILENRRLMQEAQLNLVGDTLNSLFATRDPIPRIETPSLPPTSELPDFYTLPDPRDIYPPKYFP